MLAPLTGPGWNPGERPKGVMPAKRLVFVSGPVEVLHRQSCQAVRHGDDTGIMALECVVSGGQGTGLQPVLKVLIAAKGAETL